MSKILVLDGSDNAAMCWLGSFGEHVEKKVDLIGDYEEAREMLEGGYGLLITDPYIYVRFRTGAIEGYRDFLQETKTRDIPVIVVSRDEPQKWEGKLGIVEGEHYTKFVRLEAGSDDDRLKKTIDELV